MFCIIEWIDEIGIQPIYLENKSTEAYSQSALNLIFVDRFILDGDWLRLKNSIKIKNKNKKVIRPVQDH